MKCPVCDARLREVNRRGVEIDICPECKGVWLERGELEKLLDVAAEEEEYIGDRDARARGRDDDDKRPRIRDDDDERERHRRHEEEWRQRPEAYRTQKKKSSWLSQVLESVGGEGND